MSPVILLVVFMVNSDKSAHITMQYETKSQCESVLKEKQAEFGNLIIFDGCYSK